MTMSTKFADNGSIVHVMTFDDDRVSEKLAPGVYVIEFSPMMGFYLRKKHRAFELPKKVYGSMNKKQNKVLDAYTHAERSMGVLFSGDKGSGKTMLASSIALRAIKDLELPVLLIEELLPQAPLIEFLSKVGECVLFVDEFGKKFRDDEGEQGALLGLFDGIDSHKKLVLLTENETRHINSFMLNRPGRIHYHFRYGKLEEAIVYEYCRMHKIPDDITDQIALRRESSFEFSFDTLQAIVKEYKLFGGDLNELMRDLNIEQPMDFNRYRAEIIRIDDLSAGVQRTLTDEDASTDFAFPEGSRTLHFDIKALNANSNDENTVPASAHLTQRNLVRRENDIYVYATTDDEQHDLLVTIKRKIATHMYF